MTTNGEWLFSKPFEEQVSWMNAERTESPTSDTMRHIGQVIEDTVMRGVYGDTESENADSRDKLEADVRKIAEAYNMDTQRHGSERFAHELFYSIIHLLDRQSAITSHQWESYHNGIMSEWMAKTEEMQAQVDELQAITDERWNKYIAEHLRADNLAADLLKAKNERERYRSMCSDMATKIHDVLMIVDEGLA